MRKLIRWIKDLLLEEYEVKIWSDPKNVSIHKFKKIEKITPTHIIARELDGRRFEVKTVEPFNYQVKKVH